ncbi:MAG: hemerythrin cation binding protein [Frankiales bacterium]|nr:hemerythrin cation binding protein [Frankiales bacterium]
MTDHSDDHDVLDTLTTDHREVAELFDQIEGTTDPVQRRDLTDSLISELVRHSVAEEMYVYPAIRHHVPNGDQVVDEDTDEHKGLEVLMKELEGADASAPEFLDAVRRTRALFEQHIADEEGTQFAQLRAHVPAEKLVELKGLVEVAKKLAPTRPHPLSPNAELFHKTVGPGVGLVDRLRDKLTGRPT